MDSAEDSESVNSYDEGGGKTFINKLLGEMKNQFNKAENNLESRETNKGTINIITNDSLSKAEMKITDDEKIRNKIVQNSMDRESNCSPNMMLLFKKPNSESPIRNKDTSPGRRSLRHKGTSVEENTTQSVPKRTSKRRSKYYNESILQSAIARKVESYNESSTPQWLTRQLKTTQKILENVALAKQEKSKSKSRRNSDSNLQEGDNINCSDIPKKISKKQLIMNKKKIKKLKMSHNESDKDSGSDASASVDSENNTDFIKNTRRSQRLSRNKENNDIPANPSPNIAEQANNYPNDPECSSVGTDSIASRLCLCTQSTKFFCATDNDDEVYCNAVDSINDKLIGCSRIVDIVDTPLLRPSQRIPYMTLCKLHRNRLIRHNCCPTCGIFCTEGYFMECEAKHQHHSHCQISERCPHCGISSSSSHNVFIEMHSKSQPIFLPVQCSRHPQAKMAFTSRGDSSKSPTHLIPLETFLINFESDLENQNYTVDDLIDAVKDEDIEKLSAIIASNSVNLDFKIPDFNEGTLLHYAAHKGLLKVCHLLVTAGLEVDQFDREQATPLMLAVNEIQNEVVHYLVSVGASVTVKATDGMTPLHHAAKAGNLAACRFFLSSVISRHTYIDQKDDGGWTALVWAAEHSRPDIVRYLLNEGADPKARDVEQNQALHWAAFGGGSKAAQALLDGGAEVDPRNAHGETPLHIAARENQYNCAIVLLARGADVTVVNKNNETPLDCVPESGNCYNAIALNVRLLGSLKTDYRKYKTIISNDISKGKELNPIQCINTIDDESEPRDYVYITKNNLTSDVQVQSIITTTLRSCKCEERCVRPDCECAKLSGKCWYDEEGKLTADFSFVDSPTIFECNDACECNAITCRNRVVQKSLQQRFQLFRTEGKGWGIKTLRDIPKGSFVCEYIGEILTDTDANAREDDSFMFDLDYKGAETYCVDARRYGNLARFINHSCNPNLHPVKTFIEHQDLRFPRIALFSLRDIHAEDELSFDYGHKFWLVKYKIFTCRCSSSECKYSEDTIEQTISNIKMISEAES